MTSSNLLQESIADTDHHHGNWQVKCVSRWSYCSVCLFYASYLCKSLMPDNYCYSASSVLCFKYLECAESYRNYALVCCLLRCIMVVVCLINMTKSFLLKFLLILVLSIWLLLMLLLMTTE